MVIKGPTYCHVGSCTVVPTQPTVNPDNDIFVFSELQKLSGFLPVWFLLFLQPQATEMEKMGMTSIEKHISVGSKVEIFCEEDGFQNSWFSAVILRLPYSRTSQKKRKRSSDSKVLVQYENFLSDGDHKPLTEYTDVSTIRPLPPPEAPEQVIERTDVVDAFYRDVWWTGVVTNVVGGKYYVKFKIPPDILELERSQIRLHWDWVQGIWSRPEKQVMLFIFEIIFCGFGLYSRIF